MTTRKKSSTCRSCRVVETYRLDRYDNPPDYHPDKKFRVVEAYRLDRYDNLIVVVV